MHFSRFFSMRRIKPYVFLAVMFMYFSSLNAQSSPSGSAQRNSGIPELISQLKSSYKTDSALAVMSQIVQKNKNSETYNLLVETLLASRNSDDMMIAAELLLRISAADGSKCFLDDNLASKAAKLLNHKDPFIVAIAEWAISVRVRMDNMGTIAKWPSTNQPAWLTSWQTQTTASKLTEHDYVRQAVALGAHRTVRNLLETADYIYKRTNQAAESFLIDASDEQKIALERGLKELTDAYTQFQSGSKTLDKIALRQLWIDMRFKARNVLLNNPDLSISSIAFVTQHSMMGFRNLATGSWRSDRHKPGGDILIKSGLNPDSKTSELINEKLGQGHIRGADIFWDAKSITFGFSPQPNWPEPPHEPTHIYEINIDGTGLKQLTTHSWAHDSEPAYLPDRSVVFASDRMAYGSQCGPFGQNLTVINLFRLNPERTAVNRLTYNKDIDRYPHVLDNGQVVYLRWEYQERHFYEPHTNWTVRPDGTMADAIYKQHFGSPMSVRDTRQIPGTQKLIGVATGHHAINEGILTIIDPTLGVNNSEGLELLSPDIETAEHRNAGKPVKEGGIRDDGGLYQTPWPLSPRSFLVSYSYEEQKKGKDGHNFFLYYVDLWGNKELIHRDLFLSSHYPLPIIERTRPPVLPAVKKSSSNTARTYVMDVYRNLPGIEKGKVKYLRISQKLPWPYDTAMGEIRYLMGNATTSHFGYWDWSPARIIGTVEVDKDGSAYFEVPVHVPVYFQALDENHMELRRMRSYVSFKPDELRGCIGCHESGNHAPGYSLGSMPGALTRKPQRPVPPPFGDTTTLDFERHIQPILNRNCVSCHGASNPSGGLDFSSTRNPDGFLQSYRTMFGIKPDDPTPATWDNGSIRRWYSGAKIISDREILKKWFQQVIDGNAPGQLISISDRLGDASISMPMQFGSHKSKLITTLINDTVHKSKVKMSKDDWNTLVTWVDANAQYRSAYILKHLPNRVDLNPPVFVELSIPSPWKWEEQNEKWYKVDFPESVKPLLGKKVSPKSDTKASGEEQ